MTTIELIEDWRRKFNLPIEELPVIPPQYRIDLWKSLIQEEVDETFQALDKRDIISIADGIADMLFVVVQLANECGIDVEKSVKAVYDSNMSKLITTDREEYETIQKYTNLDVSIYFEDIENTSFKKVMRSVDHKVLKGSGYKEPDFSFLNQNL